MSLRSPLSVLVTPFALLAMSALLATPAVAGPNDGSSAPAPAAQAQRADRISFTYEVTTAGTVYADLDAFAGAAREILSDARGWTLAGSIAFQPVASRGDVTLVLASPQAVEDAAPVCSRHYSCQVGDRVYINDDNWRNATPAWNRTGAPLWLYRQYLINHEVGHWLGLDHVECPAAGEPAPVMQQQSISLDGCEPTGWPLEREREAVGQRFGVPVHEWIYPDVLATYVHRDAIHAVTEVGVTEGFDDGYFRPTQDVTRAQMASFLARALALTAEGDPPFHDVRAGDPHADAITAAAEAGVVEGFDDGTYGPTQEVTRAQMATMLARAYDLEAEGEPAFRDVPAHHPHADGIAATHEAGVAEGYDDGTYRPAESVERGQMASFLHRAGATD